jgi:hypothetical protein
MASIPTVRIVAETPRGFRIINESDFDPERHERFVPAGGFDEATPEDELPDVKPGFDLRSVVSDAVAEELIANNLGDPLAIIRNADRLTEVKGVGQRLAKALVDHAGSFVDLEE